jgi:hypothetical protein
MSQNFSAIIDDYQTKPIAAWLDQVVVWSLFGLAFSIPHSIAAAQGCWIIGLVSCVARLLVSPHLKWQIEMNLVVKLLFAFVGLTIISAIFSYEPIASIRKLRGVGLFTIALLAAQFIPSRRILRLLFLTLVISCMINVVYTLGERIIGRGVKMQSLALDSPLRSAGVKEGDIILEVNGHKVRKPDDIARFINESNSGSVPVKIYRFELIYPLDIPRGQTATTIEELGILNWSRGRDWRASGFYGHYMTYAEVLQLIGSLVIGLFIALRNKRTWIGVALLIAVIGTASALLLSVTRAASLALIISSLVIVLVGARSRRAIIAMLIMAALIVPVGLFILRQQRNVGFYDPKDGSITWRQTVYKEGLALLTKSPRHFIVGVGMESIGKHWREWGLFDNGRLPVSHMHSNPLQLAVERGILTLLVWLTLLYAYARMLWKMAHSNYMDNWLEHGLILGALGGLVGFFTSGMVHYNIGDSEVAMVFYLLMGFTLFLNKTLKRQLI